MRVFSADTAARRFERDLLGDIPGRDWERDKSARIQLNELDERDESDISGVHRVDRFTLRVIKT